MGRYLVILASLLQRRDGAIAVMTALSLPFLLGLAGLSIELGHGLMTKVTNQRVADAAAFAGAQAYNATRSTGSIAPAAARVAALNGLPANAVAALLGASPRTGGAEAVQATVTTRIPLIFSRILGTAASLTVPAASTVELTPQSSGCLYALDALLPGISLSAGSLLTAVLCDISANASIAAPCGSSLQGLNISYNTTVPAQPCGTIHVGSTGLGPLVRKIVSDPLSANAGVQGIQAHGALVSAMVSPTLATAPAGGSGGIGIDFGSNTTSLPLSTKAQAVLLGCTATISNKVWTLACPAGNRTFGSLTVQSGYSLNFVPAGSTSNTYTFTGSVDTGNGGVAGGITFGPGTYVFQGDLRTSGSASTTFASANVSVAGTLTTGGSGALTFGDGTITIRQGINHFGSGALTFGAGSFSVGQTPLLSPCVLLLTNYSICATAGPLTVGGPSDIALTSGLYVAANVRVALGHGAANSYQLGRSTNGNGLVALAGSQTVFADATGTTSSFKANGSVTFTGGANSCLMLPAAAQHDINGNLDAGGGIVFGAGVYSVAGYVAIGNTVHASGTCNGRAVSVEGSDVTFNIASGLSSPLLGACALQSFCVAGGFSSAALKAPTTGTNANLLLVGPPALVNVAGTLFEGVGPDLKLSGVIYNPRGPLTIAGASGGTGGTASTTDCLMAIASRVTMTGGSLALNPCGFGAAGPTRLTLVQ